MRLKDAILCLGIGNLPCLISAIKARILNSETLFMIHRDDIKHPFGLRMGTSDIFVYKQIFIKKEYDFSFKFEPKVIVDAGANIGLASLYFANKYPYTKIIAIEPEESNYVLLKKNTSPYDNIITIKAALWNKSGHINLVDPGFGKWGFMTHDQNVSATEPDNLLHPVEAITVDKIISDNDIDRINILKVDIEGAEKEVFSDPSLWIDKVDSIITELHERMKPGCSRSFYCGTAGFDSEWIRGENIYLSKGDYLNQPVA